jgi:hypothetical protein
MTYTLKSANFTAEVGEAYAVDTTSSVVSATLPANPAQGDVIFFADARGTWMTNAVTILRNGNKIEASNVNFSNNASGSFFSVVYIDSTTGWRILTSGTKPLNINPPAVSGVYDFSATSGTWTGNPTTFTYQWQMSDDGETEWADIEDETSSTYLALEADEGKFVRVGVIATNSNGSSVIVYSAASSAINLPDFPTSGLLAFWKLDNVNDSSGNGNTLTNNNSATFGAGKIGNAVISSTSGGSYLSVSSLSPTGNWTISLWFNAPSGQNVADNIFPIISAANNNTGFEAHVNGSRALVFDTGFVGDVSFSSAVTFNQWHHLTLVFSTNVSIYLDNSLLGTGSAKVWSNPLRLGAMSTDVLRVSDNKIDAVGVWNRALTTQEIAQLYNNGNGVEPA